MAQNQAPRYVNQEVLALLDDKRRVARMLIGDPSSQTVTTLFELAAGMHARCTCVPT
jgi:hypothetical protein